MSRRVLRSVLQPAVVVGLILLVFACSGGGCSTCASCGVAPIPGGFPVADRIANSAQTRLTSSGITFIQDNITPIVDTFISGGLNFPIPTSTGSTSGVDYTLCPSGDCRAHAEIESLTLTPTAPNRISGHIRLRLWSQDASGADRAIPVRLHGLCVIICLVDTTCQANIDTRAGSRDYVGLTADIDFVADTHAARIDYTRISVASAALASGEDLEDADIDIGSCSGVSGAIIGALIPIFKGTLVSQLQSQVNGLIQSQIQSQLCTKQGMYGCPTGTAPAGGASTDPNAVCQYSDGQCVPTLLGTDGQGDLGAAFLGGFSPGTHGPGQFVLASGGDGEAVNMGMSLFFFGGWRSTDPTFTTSPGHNACVPALPPPPLPTIPRVDSFRGNVIPGTTTPTHVGIGLAQDYLNYAAYGMFDGGLLCLGAGTRLSQQLSTGLLSILISSLNSLTFPNGASAVAIAVRPQQPPNITVGTTAGAPLLDIALPQVDLDFYVWSEERYVRFMTYQADLDIGINLSVMDGQIVPMVGSLNATNAVVTNSELLTEDPATLATLVTMVLNTFAGMLTGSIPPIALPSIMGFDLMVPPGGIAGVADSGENFLGVFANLAVHPAGTPLTGSVDTSLLTSDLSIQRTGMDLAHYGQGTIPSVAIEMNASSGSGGDYEYSYRLDGMPWSAWTTDRRAVIQDPALFLQARHVVEARARIAGQVGTQDITPARADVLVDILAPQVTSDVTNGRVVVTANDVVTPPELLEYRYRTDEGAWSAWTHDATFTPPADAGSADVEVRDESDNVAGSHADLIRGLPDPTRTGGCHCSVDGHGPNFGDLSLFGFVALALAFLRRRARRSLPLAPVNIARCVPVNIARCVPVNSSGTLMSAARRVSIAKLIFFVTVPIVFGIAGCDCGSGTHPDGGRPDGMVPPPDGTMPMDCSACGTDFAATGGYVCCAAMNMCVMYGIDADCMPGNTCTAANLGFSPGTCTVHCSMCMPKPPLRPGQLATFLDMTVMDDGTPILSGYSPGVPPRGPDYGDAVVGPWDMATMSPHWDQIDGVPAGAPVTNDPNGFRHGISMPGDDVGQFSSIASKGTDVYVSYYDATHLALKVAHRAGEMGAWASHVVDMPSGPGLAGQWTSIVVTGSGAPAVSYMKVTAPMGDGKPSSHIEVAVAHNANPASASDWTIYDVGHADVACRAGWCGMGQTCLMTGECITPTTDCTMACATGDVCHMGACATALPDPWIEDLPPAYGLFTSLANTSGGLGVVWYDRSQGQIDGASFDGTMWAAPFLIDGYGSGHPRVGDSGIGASLFVDSGGTWHVSYSDGAEETLRYAVVMAGTVMSTEVVDDGSTDGTMPFPDGRHIIGDDSSIVVTAGGEVRIAYQDATLQHVMFAKRASGGTTWERSTLDGMNSTGYFIEQQLVGNVSYVATWWRDQTVGAMPNNGVRLMMTGM